MNLIDAIKSGLPLRRPNKSFSYINPMSYFALRNKTMIAPGTWIDPDFFLSQYHLTKEDVLANDWEIKLEFETEEV